MEKCFPCNKVSYLGDMRGIQLWNPACDCTGHLLSRLQVAGEGGDQVNPRALHYTCAVGGCDFFAYKLKVDGQVKIMPSGMLQRENMIKRGL